jgi:hypothetical protein
MSGAGPDYAVAQGWFEIDRSGIRISLLQRIANPPSKELVRQIITREENTARPARLQRT